MKIKIFLILFLCFLTSGCWNYNELDDFAIVTGMGIDEYEDGYKVSLVISKGKKIIVPDFSNKTVDDVISWVTNINLKVSFNDFTNAFEISSTFLGLTFLAYSPTTSGNEDELETTHGVL